MTMKPQQKMSRLNPPGQTVGVRLDGGGREALRAEDIAWALADLKGNRSGSRITPLGVALLRVKWAQQSAFVTALQFELLREVTHLADKQDWRTHKPGIYENMTTLALRELGAIHPEQYPGHFHWQDAVKYMTLDVDPDARIKDGKPIKNAKRIMLSNGKKITKADKLRWALIVNQSIRMGEAEGIAVETAEKVILGELTEIVTLPVPIKYIPGPEMCHACNGVHTRKRAHKIIECPQCINGSRKWGDAGRARFVGMSSAAWPRWAPRLSSIMEILKATERKSLKRLGERTGNS